MSDELELEILSYREFKRREALLAWEQRRRAFEARIGSRPPERRPADGTRRPLSLMVRAHVQKQNDRNRYPEQPQ